MPDMHGTIESNSHQVPISSFQESLRKHKPPSTVTLNTYNKVYSREATARKAKRSYYRDEDLTIHS
jgi:hypothetical protein